MQREAAGAGECRHQLPRLKHGAHFIRDAPARANALLQTHPHTHTHTAIQVARQPLAGRAGKAWRWAVDHGAGLAGLGLSAPAVAELGAKDQEPA